MSKWRKLVLFGDSLTQYSFQESGWGAIISDKLQRKGDVLNRGFSGYTTDHAVRILERVFPSGSMKETDSVIVFFGANDASIMESKVIVPGERYASNLHKIVQYIIDFGISSKSILLVSPPPVDEQARKAFLLGENCGYTLDVLNANTKYYANICGKVAAEKCCPFVNLWNNFMEKEDYSQYFNDGLHFSKLGNILTAELLLPHVLKMTDCWQMNFPYWRDFDL